ncbi:MAG: flavin reductase family protein [Ruminococcaceae bacterium]|nr:flavin reductase family protein [Oscillospiraceae bacterium]
MNQFHEISPEQMNKDPFSLIGKDWMLIGAQNGDTVNAMTASWGGMGVLWHKNVVFTFIRPQRFTKTLVDASDHFSLTFFDESYRDTLAYFGKVSGFDEDKIKTSGLTIESIDGAPCFKEGKLILICKKLYAGDILPEGFFSDEIDARHYPGKDYHTMYVGEIEKVLVKNEA